MDIRTTLEALYDAFNAHDLDRIRRSFPRTVSWTCPEGAIRGGRTSRANRAFEQRWPHVEGLPDVHYGNAEHFVDLAATLRHSD